MNRIVTPFGLVKFLSDQLWIWRSAAEGQTCQTRPAQTDLPLPRRPSESLDVVMSSGHGEPATCDRNDNSNSNGNNAM